MEPLNPGASLPKIQDYVARMEIERGGQAGSTVPVPQARRGSCRTVPGSSQPARTASGPRQDPGGRIAGVRDEAADTLILLISIANRCGINLEDALRAKESRNETRIWI